ncbi:hypothetical protein TNCV_4182471 [Trichonephila clavipes]|nr:hypothetical protein TNCV_4182471 [Trichonephila clavipes]
MISVRSNCSSANISNDMDLDDINSCTILRVKVLCPGTGLLEKHRSISKVKFQRLCTHFSSFYVLHRLQYLDHIVVKGIFGTYVLSQPTGDIIRNEAPTRQFSAYDISEIGLASLASH